MLKVGVVEMSLMLSPNNYFAEGCNFPFCCMFLSSLTLPTVLHWQILQAVQGLASHESRDLSKQAQLPSLLYVDGRRLSQRIHSMAAADDRHLM